MTDPSGARGDGRPGVPPERDTEDVAAPGGRSPATPAENPYVVVQRSAEFQELRRKFRGFVFPVAVFFLTWYFLYVLCAVLAPGFMSIRVLGNINIGLIFGLLQFVSTFVITFAYARWANRVFDPAAEKVAATLGEVTT